MFEKTRAENIFISIHLSNFNEKTNLGKCSSWFCHIIMKEEWDSSFGYFFPSSLGVLFDFYK